jgi:hypothetical protein
MQKLIDWSFPLCLMFAWTIATSYTLALVIA